MCTFLASLYLLTCRRGGKAGFSADCRRVGAAPAARCRRTGNGPLDPTSKLPADPRFHAFIAFIYHRKSHKVCWFCVSPWQSSNFTRSDKFSTISSIFFRLLFTILQVMPNCPSVCCDARLVAFWSTLTDPILFPQLVQCFANLPVPPLSMTFPDSRRSVISCSVVECGEPRASDNCSAKCVARGVSYLMGHFTGRSIWKANGQVVKDYWRTSTRNMDTSHESFSLSLHLELSSSGDLHLVVLLRVASTHFKLVHELLWPPWIVRFISSLTPLLTLIYQPYRLKPPSWAEAVSTWYVFIFAAKSWFRDKPHSASLQSPCTQTHSHRMARQC